MTDREKQDEAFAAFLRKRSPRIAAQQARRMKAIREGDTPAQRQAREAREQRESAEYRSCHESGADLAESDAEAESEAY